MKITHSLVSAVADDGVSGEIEPSHWNASHVVAVQYPALKPATPTYDFEGAALDGAFSAHSSQGSFATSDCLTQGADWVGSSLEMGFSNQMGALYVSHADADLDFHVGGLRRSPGFTDVAAMQGIAALNSSGTGIGVVVYNDGFMYIAAITAWSYASQSDSWSAVAAANSQGPWWMRLKRVSGTWTAYGSVSGRVWDHTFGTRADAITVDRLAVGLLYNSATAYYGRLTADYLHVAV